MLFLGAFVEALVDVLAIIGIILVGGFLIFFLGDLVLSVLDPSYTLFGKKKNKNKDSEKEDVKEIENVKEVEKIEYKEPAVEENNLAVSPVEEEFKFDDEENAVSEIEEAKEDALSDIRAEEELFKANMLKAIEERRGKQQEAKESATNNFFFDDEDLNAFDDEEEDFEGIEVEPEQEEISEAVEEQAVETVEEPLAETVEEPAVEETTDEASQEETNEELEALRKVIEEQKAKFEAEKQALLAKNEELAKQLENKEEVVVVESAPTGSIEDYEARLETLKQRLAENEKELRKVKKEYIPLRKVARTLESDEKKLRRKEALVAKQKVVLYGVNNIGEIDEEKAKKLEEDLDILEGFKLSVQHCQEVMEENKERYPILENTYNILTQNNNTIRNDIEEVEKAIEELKNSDAE